MKSNITKFTPTQYQIITEIGKAFDNFGAKSDLQTIIGSWGDTMPDEEILEMIREWNAKKQPQHQ